MKSWAGRRPESSRTATGTDGRRQVSDLQDSARHDSDLQDPDLQDSDLQDSDLQNGDLHDVADLSGARPWWGWLSLVVRLGLAVVFGWSGVVKAGDPVATETAVRAYSLLPDGLVSPVATALPWFEIALALLLVAGLATRFVAVLSAVLMVVFIVGVASAAARGLSIDCGCFGGGGAVAPGETRYTAEIVRDAVFLLMASYLVWRPSSRFSLDGVIRNAQVRQA